MFDDFQVPEDPGYQFDDYGPGKAVTPVYITLVVKKFGLGACYPAIPSSDKRETRLV